MVVLLIVFTKRRVVRTNGYFPTLVTSRVSHEKHATFPLTRKNDQYMPNERIRGSSETSENGLSHEPLNVAITRILSLSDDAKKAKVLLMVGVLRRGITLHTNNLLLCSKVGSYL